MIMKKTIQMSVLGVIAACSFSSCLDMTPISEITDENMWKNEGHFTSFMYGIHSRLRDADAQNLFMLGELRSDIYNTGIGWTGESNQVEEITSNTLTEERPGIENYGGLYYNINQINLFLSRAETTDLLSEADRNYYLGEAYGLRAFYYFHLLRSWGNVVWNADPSLGFEVGNLERPATDASTVMQHIKDDIASSETAFGDDYSFRAGRSLWSKAATLTLKAEAYLWSSRQMNGGTADAQTALEALNDVQTHISRTELDLLPDFASVFDYENKGNNEIIFSLHAAYNEADLFNGEWRNRMVPQQTTLSSYYESDGSPISLNFNGNVYYPLREELYSQFDEADTRLSGTLRAVYSKDESGTVAYVGCFAYKFRGMTPAGASYREFCDDYPIYRYADVLLLKAEAEAVLGSDPAEEINQIRQRAYAGAYEEASMGYPHLAGDNEGINEVLLRERLREFMFEGKRWYDLRRFGQEYVMKYSSLQNPDHLLWPIDTDTMTDNPALTQTPGYE